MLLTVPTFELILSLALIGIVCELCGRISNELEEICDIITRLNWYLMPCKVQMDLLIILGNLQQPVDFDCFGSLKCNRETFKKV